MASETPRHAENLVAPRLAKLKRLRDLDIDPFPHNFERTHTSVGALSEFEDGKEDSPVCSVAGRLVRLNRMGKSAFVHIQDGAGRIQLYLQKNVLGEDQFTRFLDLFDIGDFLGASGTLFRTRAGEITVRVESLHMLSKSLRPLPEKFHGLSDHETRYRQRYLDLIAGPEVRSTFRMRTAIISEIRRILDGRGYLEVETPILQPLYGGGSARPFVTHYNVLGRDFYLRIADELYLKRLIIGGFDKVYEISKDFRNEGIDRTHSPELTMLECYEAYVDYEEIMRLTESIVAQVATKLYGAPVVETEAWRLDFTPPWRRISFSDAIRDQTGLNIDDYPEAAGLAEAAARFGVVVDPDLGRGKVLDSLLEKLVNPLVEEPTFIVDYPVETSPLAKRRVDDERYAARFETMAAGIKFANAFSELNDPLDQRRRFEEQAQARAAGDEEAQVLDEDFLLAMEYGMPPTGGLGIGIDRLTMLMTGHRNIREVILFPQLRTKN